MMTSLHQYPCKHCAQHHAFDGLTPTNPNTSSTPATTATANTTLLTSSSSSPVASTFKRHRHSEQNVPDLVMQQQPQSQSMMQPITKMPSSAANSTRKKERRAPVSLPSNAVDSSLQAIASHHRNHHLPPQYEQLHHNRIIGHTGTDQSTCRRINCTIHRCSSRTTIPSADKLMQNDHQILSISGVQMSSNDDRIDDRQQQRMVTAAQPITSITQFYQPPTCIQSALADQWPGSATKNVFPSSCQTAELSANEERSRPRINATAPISAATPHRCQQIDSTVSNVQINNDSQLNFKFAAEANRWKTREDGKSRGTEENGKRKRCTAAAAAPKTLAACTFAHVLLFCFVFAAFGMGGHRNSCAYASELKNISKLSPPEGSEYLFLLL